MNNVFPLLVLLTLTNTSFGQESYGIINDSDGYTNVRMGPGINHEIIGKVEDNEVFYIEESNEDWYLIYLLEESFREGYIHSSRVQRLSELESVGKREYKSGLLTIKDEKYELTIGHSDFDKSAHEYDLQDGKWVIKIDGAIPYGVDGGYPTTEISTFQLKANGKLIDTPKRAYSDLYENSDGLLKIHKKSNGTIFIIMTGNSDGAGAYDAIWIYLYEKFLKRVIVKL